MPEGVDVWTDDQKAALRDWNRARAKADLYNRNLLQYAGAIAAVFGIAAGSGGLFAVADSLANSGAESTDLVPDWVYLAISLAAGILATVLFALLTLTFVRRGEFEDKAQKHKLALVDARPDLFVPRD